MKEMIKQLNISGFYHAKGEDAVQNLQFNQIPLLKMHDAEMCYRDAKKVQDQQLLDVKQLSKMIKEAGSDFQIASHYTSPLYLANLTLHKNEIRDKISLKEKGELSFAVLEAEDDANIEGLNFDGSQQQFMPSQEMELLLKLRMEQSLHQKACALLGRSFKNAVVHNQRGSIKSKASEKHLSMKLNMRI